jgi:hypothetical protein
VDPGSLFRIRIFPSGQKESASKNLSVCILVLLENPGFNFKESMPPAYVAWVADRVLLLRYRTVCDTDMYTLYVHTAGGGKGYPPSLHVHTAGGGKEYTLHVHTAGEEYSGGETETPCTSIDGWWWFILAV